MPSLSKQKVLKAKEAVLAKSMEKGKEKEKDPSKANRKTTEPPLKGGSEEEITGLGYTRYEEGGGMVSLFHSLKAMLLVRNCVDHL